MSDFEIIGFLAVVTLAWVGGWMWRVRTGLLDEAESDAQRVFFWVLVGGMPAVLIVASAWLLTHES